MFKILVVFLILIIGAAVCNDVPTIWPNADDNAVKQPIDFPVPNNNRQSFNASTTPARKKPKARLDIIIKDRNKDPKRPNVPYGKIVSAPTASSRTPPPFRSDIEMRRIGGAIKGNPIVFPPSGGLPGTSHGDIYGGGGRGGIRHDMETWGYDRYSSIGRNNKNVDAFVPQPEVYEGEEDLVKDNHEGTKCELDCDEMEFQCVQSCQCLHKDLRCDGNIDCNPYGEDEKDCEELNEEIMKNLRNDCEKSGDRVLCPTTFTCISKRWLCDGDDDCGDFSDETHCGERTNCTKDQFECGNGLCIPNQWLCDGDNDCKDFSDEWNCTRTCTQNEFECNDKTCVSASFRCDGETDCNDGSDEQNCDTRLASCPEGEFRCRGSLGGMGGPGGRCVLMRYRCDGDNDCGDWSDEENCPRKQSSCTASEFRCDDGTCISKQWMCDAEQDCDSGEDEKGCPAVPKEHRSCTTEEFTCQDKRCIMKSWVCDGIADCKRGEDEIGCEPKCELGQFACPPVKANVSNTRICISQKHVCDGHPDCPNGADEDKCPIEHPCNAHSKCEQLCVTDHKAREQCACRVGFILQENGLNCTDIDECQFTQSPVCSQVCTNTYGSFRCSCQDGYVLRPDLRSCKALGGAVKLIMAHRADIRQVSLSNNKYTSLIKGLPNAISVDYHYKKGLLFWSDVSTDVIRKSFINGTGARDIIRYGLESPGGIAVDWVHELIFWTDSGTRRVEVANYDGSLRAVIAANDLDKPRAIVVHPGEALVIFSDWGPTPKIDRIFMDGSERTTIINEGIFWPNGLTFDYSAERLYWADAKYHIIESANIDGSNRKKIMSNNLPHPFALTIFEDSLFWTDWQTKSISTANKVTGKGYRHIHDELHFPMDLHAFHPSRQPEYKSRCTKDRRGNRGGCSHMCLPNRSGRKCRCPIGLSLKDDGKTCTSEPDQLLLVARKKDIRIRQLNSKDPSKEIDMVIPLDGLKSIVALDWCSETDVIYWTDVGRSAIGKAFLNGSNQEILISSNLVSPAGLALDWVTQKLYWTDPGTNRIEVATTNGRNRALLVWQDLDKPRDIVVNPIDGYMFWCDWGVALIERAGMDGSDRKVIVRENIKWPNGLAVDWDNSRLFFVDGGTKTLEYINYDGTGRNRLIADGLQHPFGVDVFNRRVFWTDWETQSVQYTDMSLSNSKLAHQNGNGRKFILNNTSDLMDVRVFHRNRKDIRNPCAGNNGGCSHMCLLRPNNGYSCACPIGVLLSSDEHTCEKGPKNYVVFAHRIDIRQVSLDIDHLIDVVLPLPPTTNAVALDIDRKTGDIYWADTEEDAIFRSTSDGQQIRQIHGESMSVVDGLVVDSVGRKIYWTDAGRHCIEVSELNGDNRNVLIWQDIESPRGIAIDYEFGYLFWSDWSSTSPRIERADMDGDKRSRIITAELEWPNGLAVDSLKKRIYWTDAKKNHIMKADYEGNFRETLVRDLPHPYGVAVGKDLVFFTDWKTQALHYVSKNVLHDVKTIVKDLEGLMDVKIVEEGELRLTNACHHNNGGCSHLCLRKPQTHSCKCPTGIRLKEGSSTECEDLPTAYLLIALRSGIGRISLDTPELFDVVLPIEGVHGAVVLDFHYKQSLLFYADVNIDAIRSVDMLNYTNSRTIVSTGLSTPNGIAVDWVANNIYWSDSEAKKIEVARIDGSYRKVILHEGLEDPRSLIVYPKKGYLYVADWAPTPRIDRALMNGADRKPIINSDIGFPTGLAIDFEAKKLYWADALQDRIEMAELDGTKRTQVISHTSHPFGFTIHQSNIYWTNWYNKSVLRAMKKISSNPNVDEVRHGLRGALDIRAVSRKRQPEDDGLQNPCARQNGDCSHLCLFAGRKYSCECPDQPDSRPCRPRTITLAASLDDTTEDPWPSDHHRPPRPSTRPPDSSKLAKAFVTATTVLGIILLIVVIAILALMYSPKRRKHQNKSRGSQGSVLTFANPNYNGADALNQAGHSRNASAKNSGIWKRLKYDKGQDRVYEVKCLGLPDTATTTLMSGTPSPSSSAILPLSTIG